MAQASSSRSMLLPSPDSNPSSSSSSNTPPGSTASPPEKKKKLSGWKHSAAGSLGGMTGAIVTSPFDVVKTRLQSDMFRHTSSSRVPPSQTAKAAAAAAVPSRGGLWHFVDTIYMMRRISVDEGWRALYKGLGPTLVGIIPARATNFYFYPTTKAYLARQFPNAPTEQSGQTAEDSPLIHLSAAVVAGVMTATVTNPIWVVKTRLQLSASKREAPSFSSAPPPSLSRPPTSPLPRPIAASAAALAQQSASLSTPAGTATLPARSAFGSALALTKDIFAKEGISGLYRGLSASFLGVSEGVIQWVLYERFKRLSAPHPQSLSERSLTSHIVSIVSASGGAKAIASLITYPHEVLRTRLRQPPGPGGRKKYFGLGQTLKLILKEEGAASLYGGLTAHLFRVVPNAACMFLIYEVVAEKLG